MLFRQHKNRYLGKRSLFRSRPFQRKNGVPGKASRYAGHNEGFSDGKRVFKGAFQSICKDVSDKEDIHKRSRGWKDESFNKEVDVREKEINKHMQKGRGRFPTATEPLIQRVTDKVNAISQIHS